MTLAYDLARCLRSRRLARLRVPRAGACPAIGLVISISDELVILEEFSNFARDGFYAYRLADCKELVQRDTDAFLTRVFEGEGLHLPRRLDARIEAGTVRSLLTSLQDIDRPIGVRAEWPANDSGIAWMPGRVISVGETSFELHYFNDAGLWDDETTTIGLDAVQRVDFDVRYVNTFARYLPAPRLEESDR